MTLMQYKIKIIIKGADMNELELKKLFGKRLRSIRKNKGLTQEYLSELIGLDPQYYCKMENGNHFPSVKTLAKIAQVLKIKPKDLFNFSDSQNSLLEKVNTSLLSLSEKELDVVRFFVSSIVKLR